MGNISNGLEIGISQIKLIRSFLVLVLFNPQSIIAYIFLYLITVYSFEVLLLKLIINVFRTKLTEKLV